MSGLSRASPPAVKPYADGRYGFTPQCAIKQDTLAPPPLGPGTGYAGAGQPPDEATTRARSAIPPSHPTPAPRSDRARAHFLRKTGSASPCASVRSARSVERATIMSSEAIKVEMSLKGSSAFLPASKSPKKNIELTNV